jgi:hypothetical protein
MSHVSDDRRVVQVGEDLSLSGEALGFACTRHDLECDRLSGESVEGAVDGSHPAASSQTLDDESVGDHVSDARIPRFFAERRRLE